MADQKITVEHLAADERFQQWVLAPTPELDRYWKAWLQQQPMHERTLTVARHLVQNLHLKNEAVPEPMQAAIWERVKTTIHTPADAPFRPWNRQRVGYWAAASLLVLLAAAALFYYQQQTITRYRTAYGETKVIALPDGSRVTLNAHSALSFSTDWQKDQAREVWLEGEAFFEVKKIALSSNSSSSMRVPFIVHSHTMNVEVLGTTFNVKDRDRYSEVVLNTGKVSVTPQQEQEAAPIAMLPGDRLSYSAREREWEIQQVNAEIRTSWRKQELIFDEMPLAEIALLLEETYGYTIVFQEEKIKTYTFTGNIKSDEIDLLIPMLARSFALEIKQEGRSITFSEK